MATAYDTPLLVSEQGDAAFRKLMAAPLKAPRKKIRRAKVDIGESVSTVGKRLADLYKGHRIRSVLCKPLPTYRQWLGSVLDPADADREDARAKQEWADRKAGLFSRAAARRRKQIVAGMLRAVCPVPAAATAPLPERKPPNRKSRSSWPSYYQRTIDALIAAQEWEFLSEIGHASEVLPEYREAA